MTYELWIDGVQADLSTSATIAITKQVALLADIQGRKADFTNRFELPKTTTNMRILERMNVVGNTSTRPYQYADCVIKAGSIPVVTNGRFIATATKSRNTFEGLVITGNDSIFKLLEGRMLSDLDTSYLTATFNIDTYESLIGSFTGTDFIPLNFPIIDSGQGLNPAGSTDMTNYNIGLEPEYQIPSILMSYLVNKIFDEAGIPEAYDDTPFFATDLKFLSSSILLIPHDPEYLQTVIAEAQQAEEISPVEISAGTTTDDYYMVYDTEIQDVDNLLSHEVAPDRTEYTAGFTATHTFEVNINVEVVTVGVSHLRSIRVITYVNGVAQQVNNLEGGIILVFGGLSLTGSFTYGLDLQKGDTVYFLFRTTCISPSTTANLEIISASIKITPKEVTQLYLNDIIVNKMLPKVSQVDFIKMVMQQFGLIPQWTSNGTPYFVTIESILTGVNGVDIWTDKFVREEQETYTIGSYGQSSNMKYKYSSSDLTPFADYEVVVDNDSYPAEADVISSINYATDDLGELYEYLDENGDKGAKNCLKVEYYDENDLLIQVKDMRVVYLFPINLINRDDNSDIGTFTLASFNELYWEELYNDYYASLFRIVERPIKKEIRLNLNIVDVYRLNHFKLKYFEQYNGLFYLEKLNNFIAGKTCTGTFIQVQLADTPKCAIVTLDDVNRVLPAVIGQIEVQFVLSTLTGGSTFTIDVYDESETLVFSGSYYDTDNPVTEVITTSDDLLTFTITITCPWDGSTQTITGGIRKLVAGLRWWTT